MRVENNKFALWPCPETVKVVFRKWPDGEVIALFPQEPADLQGYICMSYLHVGQHGDASISIVVRQTKLAEQKDYADLLDELMDIGYTCIVIGKRCTGRDDEIRRQKAKEYREN